MTHIHKPIGDSGKTLFAALRLGKIEDEYPAISRIVWERAAMSDLNDKQREALRQLESHEPEITAPDTLSTAEIVQQHPEPVFRELQMTPPWASDFAALVASTDNSDPLPPPSLPLPDDAPEVSDLKVPRAFTDYFSVFPNAADEKRLPSEVNPDGGYYESSTFTPEDLQRTLEMLKAHGMIASSDENDVCAVEGTLQWVCEDDSCGDCTPPLSMFDAQRIANSLGQATPDGTAAEDDEDEWEDEDEDEEWDIDDGFDDDEDDDLYWDDDEDEEYDDEDDDDDEAPVLEPEKAVAESEDFDGVLAHLRRMAAAANAIQHDINALGAGPNEK